MKVRFGFDMTVHGEAESMPDGTIAFSGPRQDAVKSKVVFYAEQLADATEEAGGENAPTPTADDLLRYIVGRMHGRSWAVDVTHGEPKPGGPA